MTYFKNYWLNEESRTFLNRGYITETPEERIKHIAYTAQKLLNIDGFANKFEDYMQKGYYSLSTPVWTNFGKNKGILCKDDRPYLAWILRSDMSMDVKLIEKKILDGEIE